MTGGLVGLVVVLICLLSPFYSSASDCAGSRWQPHGLVIAPSGDCSVLLTVRLKDLIYLGSWTSCQKMNCAQVGRGCAVSCAAEYTFDGETNEEIRDWRSCRGNLLVRTRSFLYDSFGRLQIDCHTLEVNARCES